MFYEIRFERMIDRLRDAGGIPLRLELWNGRGFDFSPIPTVKIVIPQMSALRYFVRPDFNKLGEAFVEGHIQVEGSIHDIFRVAEHLAGNATNTTRKKIYRLAAHSRQSDRTAIELHYDVSNEFYSSFLDRKMVYSCAYYESETDTLDTAQEQKLDHILRKLRVKPGERLLDIGCGWGALLMHAAKHYGALATGITLSQKQFDYVQEKITREGLQERCSVKLMDYRDFPGVAVFDKIASVGMFEHVGLKNLPVYFAKIHSLLKDDGLVLNHGITSSDVDNHWIGLGAGEFIDRYVFPQGELPHLSLVQREMSRAGLEVCDVESLRRHYAKTCHEWASRLEHNAATARRHTTDKQLRIWQIYLAGCAYGFANGWINIYQILASKNGIAGVHPLPLTRAYMYQ